MQYFGYLRRNPCDDFQVTDHSGFEFWAQ
jgi:hypothetical protein